MHNLHECIDTCDWNMMNIIQINGIYRAGSTGRIMYDLDKVIDKSNNIGYMVCAYGKSDIPNDEKLLSIYNSFSSTPVKINLLISRLTGEMGYRHKRDTKRIIRWIDSKKPDIIHLHNIHGDWINIRILFDYLKRVNVPVIWTLHDCWSITGRCSHFENCGCLKWKTGCYKCENKYVYPKTYIFDWSKNLWNDKQNMFTSLENMTLVTPSDWLGNYVKQSYMAQYPVLTIHNGIDIETFKPRSTSNDLRSVIGNRKMILGVAASWTERKGLYDFFELANLLGNEYLVTLVGLNENQMKSLPANIYGLSRTNNIDELVELYCAAEYYVNLTYLDTYPTTNLEAQACGTPTITYETGGSPESVHEKSYIVKQGCVAKVADIILEGKRQGKEYYRKIAEQFFSADTCFKAYLDLYNSVYK